MNKMAGIATGVVAGITYLYIANISQDYIAGKIAHDIKNSHSELFANEPEIDIRNRIKERMVTNTITGISYVGLLWPISLPTTFLSKY